MPAPRFQLSDEEENFLDSLQALENFTDKEMSDLAEGIFLSELGQIFERVVFHAYNVKVGSLEEKPS